MTTQENVRNAARAQALKAEHEALKGEIDAREESFELATEMCTAMEQTAWIRDKEVMIQAGDTGRDYEHCQALQRNDDVDSDMRVDDTRIKTINTLAEKTD
ncbi:spectrin repeat [Holotrichia oblita]|uniref:Spectrin repeat n=1 Tax=Holotrichia oblita TaxID=644536 RepID=A0ACB9STN8_HOLOL|nr:spectrin repeat [Holotrichia oblita]